MSTHKRRILSLQSRFSFWARICIHTAGCGRAGVFPSSKRLKQHLYRTRRWFLERPKGTSLRRGSIRTYWEAWQGTCYWYLRCCLCSEGCSWKRSQLRRLRRSEVRKGQKFVCGLIATCVVCPEWLPRFEHWDFLLRYSHWLLCLRTWLSFCRLLRFRLTTHVCGKWQALEFLGFSGRLSALSRLRKRLSCQNRSLTVQSNSHTLLHEHGWSWESRHPKCKMGEGTQALQWCL